jgi:hypothetical protein
LPFHFQSFSLLIMITLPTMLNLSAWCFLVFAGHVPPGDGPANTVSPASDIPRQAVAMQEGISPAVHAAVRPGPNRLLDRPCVSGFVWRKTHEGWQQIPLVSRPSVHYLVLPEQRPRLHPFSVASLTLLAALAAMAWASSEWDWSRLAGCDW